MSRLIIGLVVAVLAVGCDIGGQAPNEPSPAGDSPAAVKMSPDASVPGLQQTTAPDAGEPEPETPPKPKEFRAVWVTRFAYSKPADVKRLIQKAADAGFNVVFFQIRGNGDAYYRSSLVPWAKRLTGVLGKDPGWDPLQLAIDEAHARGIELHAYWNVFAGWTPPAGCGAAGTCACRPEQGRADSCVLPEASAAGAPEHFLRANPEAIAVTSSGTSVDSEYYWLSPGNPLVRQHLVQVATELVKDYAIDGLHLDRVRYPGESYSHDPASLAAYAAETQPRPSYADWQRGQVTRAVAEIGAVLHQHRPKALYSAAVWGIYQPLPGCNTSQGFKNYYQDSLGWTKAGIMDALVPMMYWDLNSGCTDWAKLLDGFLAGANGRFIIAGMHAIDSGSSKPQPPRIAARIAHARATSAPGIAIYASAYLDMAPEGQTSGDTWATFQGAGAPFEAAAVTHPIPWH